jgi:hypothetical protein
MPEPRIIRLRGLEQDVKNILESGKWMTSGQIASQIVWPPEIACREKTKRIRAGGRRVSIFGAHSGLVARVLSHMFKAGKLKRRDVHTSGRKSFLGAKYEYRI